MTRFYAFLARLKYIRRWGLMRGTRPENNAEHSHQVAVLAHALCAIRNVHFGGTLNPDRAAVLALFHDASEIITGDLPTPVKYHDPALQNAYRAVEQAACGRLIGMLPEELRSVYEPLLGEGLRAEDEPLWQVVHAADKLAAYLKCVEERQTGNQEFRAAERSIRAELERRCADGKLPELRWFLDNCAGAFELTLDELD